MEAVYRQANPPNNEMIIYDCYGILVATVLVQCKLSDKWKKCSAVCPGFKAEAKLNKQLHVG